MFNGEIIFDLKRILKRLYYYKWKKGLDTIYFQIQGWQILCTFVLGQNIMCENNDCVAQYFKK